MMCMLETRLKKLLFKGWYRLLNNLGNHLRNNGALLIRIPHQNFTTVDRSSSSY